MVNPVTSTQTTIIVLIIIFENTIEKSDLSDNFFYKNESNLNKIKRFEQLEEEMRELEEVGGGQYYWLPCNHRSNGLALQKLILYNLTYCKVVYIYIYIVNEM